MNLIVAEYKFYHLYILIQDIFVSYFKKIINNNFEENFNQAINIRNSFGLLFFSKFKILCLFSIEKKSKIIDVAEIQ